MRTSRTLAAAALLLLGVTGCVSVPPAPEPAPAPSLALAGDRSPSPLEPSAAQPSAREALASTDPVDEPKDAKARPKAKENAAGQRGDEKQRPAVAPPARRVAPEPGHRAHPHPRAPQPRTGHNMRELCEQSDGLTNPEITAMCRDAYGPGRR